MSEKKESTEVQPIEVKPMSTDSQRDVAPPRVLDEQFEQLLERNLPRFMERITAEYSQSVSLYRGPLPSASELEKLKAIDPTFPEQLLTMAKAEQEHAHAMERLVIDTNAQTIRENQRLFARGQAYGFAIGTITVIAGVVTALYGEPLAGSFIGTGGVAALVIAFIYGARKGAVPGEVKEGATATE